MSARRGRIGTWAVVVSILAGACGATPTPTGQPTGRPPVVTKSSAPSADLSLTVDADPSSFAGLPPDEPGRWVSRFVNLSLYQPDNTLAMTPAIAAAMPVTSSDGLTWTIPLRSGLRFSDGSALTSQDVVYSYHLVLSRQCRQDPATCSAVQTSLASVVAEDPVTVVFTLKEPSAPFLVDALGAVPVLPMVQIERSFAMFTKGSAAASATEVRATSDRIFRSLSDARCTGRSGQPASCEQSSYVAELEQLLMAAGVTVPDAAGYAGQSGVDSNAYGEALIYRLGELDASLRSAGVDRVAAALDLLDFARHPVGAGPYRFESYAAGREVVLARNPYYWRLRVAPPEVRIEIIRDAATASTALKQGDILWQPDVAPDALPSLEADPTLSVSEFSAFNYYYIAFNVRRGHVYSDVNLRRAFTMCIDHDEDVARATGGMGIPVYANVPPASWAFDHDVPRYGLDEAGARRLIEASGWTRGADGIYEKGGVRLSTVLYVRGERSPRLAFSDLARDQLRACGIEVLVTEAEFQSVILPALRYPNNFDTYLGSTATGLDPNDYATFHSSQMPTLAAPALGNFAGWNSQEADRLIELGRTTLPRDQRLQIYRQFQVLVHDEAPFYFLWSDTAHSGISKRVTAQPPDTIDLASPLWWWNLDAWQVAP
jgi:ABC-type transport system substrate-binding protein